MAQHAEWMREAFDNLSGGGGRSAYGRCRECGAWLRLARIMRQHVARHTEKG